MNQPIAGDAKAIVVFDGICVLCNGAVKFIIQRDPQARYQFTAMQSEFGQQLIADHQLGDISGDTFLLVEAGQVKVRTDAALSIAANLHWPWHWFRVLRVFPVGFRDYFYRWLARHRYQLFGKMEQCMVPDDAMKHRFIQLRHERNQNEGMPSVTG